MAIAHVVQCGAAAVSPSTTTAVLSISAAPSAGNMVTLIIGGVISGSGNTVTVTDSKGNTWATDSQPSGGNYIAIASTMQNAGTLTTSDTITATATANWNGNVALWAEAFSGVNTGTRVDQQSTVGHGGGTSTDTGNLTPTASGDLCLAVNFHDPGGSTDTINTTGTVGTYTSFATASLSSDGGRTSWPCYQVLSGGSGTAQKHAWTWTTSSSASVMTSFVLYKSSSASVPAGTATPSVVANAPAKAVKPNAGTIAPTVTANAATVDTSSGTEVNAGEALVAVDAYPVTNGVQVFGQAGTAAAPVTAYNVTAAVGASAGTVTASAVANATVGAVGSVGGSVTVSVAAIGAEGDEGFEPGGGGGSPGSAEDYVAISNVGPLAGAVAVSGQANPSAVGVYSAGTAATAVTVNAPTIVTGGAVTQVGSATSNTSTLGTDVTVTKPTGVQSGDVIIAFGCTTETTPYFDTVPSGFTEFAESADGDTPNLFKTTAWYKVCGGSEPANYTFGSGGAEGAGAPIVITMAAWRGVDTANPILHVSEVAGGSSSEPADPATSFTQSSDGRLFFARAVRSTSAIVTFSNGTADWSELVDDGEFSGGTVRYSIGLYAFDETTGSGSRTEPAITASATETDNVYILGCLKALSVRNANPEIASVVVQANDPIADTTYTVFPGQAATSVTAFNPTVVEDETGQAGAVTVGVTVNDVKTPAKAFAGHASVSVEVRQPISFAVQVETEASNAAAGIGPIPEEATQPIFATAYDPGVEGGPAGNDVLTQVTANDAQGGPGGLAGTASAAVVANKPGVGYSGADTGVGVDAGETIEVVDGDTGAFVEAVTDREFSDRDTGTFFDEGLPSSAFPESGDTATGVEGEFVDRGAPPSRTLKIPAESRVKTVAAESRVYRIPAESRVKRVKP